MDEHLQENVERKDTIMTWAELVESEIGYKPFTTFWQDFTIADAFGETANKEMAKIEIRLKRNRDAWILGDLGDQEYEANKILISEKKDALAASISSLSVHLKNNEEQLELIDQNKALSVGQIKEIINKTWRENDKQKMHEIVQKFITKAIVEYADEAQRDKLITLYLANGTEQHYIKKYYKREVHRVAYNKERREWIVIDDDVHFMYQYRNWN